MIVLRLHIKDHKWTLAQFLEISVSFPKQNNTLAYAVTQPIKSNHPIFWGLLSSQMAHSASVECVSL